LRSASEAAAARAGRGRTRLRRHLLIGTPEIGLTLTPPEFYAGIAKQFGIPYEGGVLTKILRSGDLKSDQIHPNAQGYRLMAERVADLLRKSGAI
jgi:acyl-CoA thioesterase I